MWKKPFVFFVLLLVCSFAFSEKITFSSDSMFGKSGSKSDETKLFGNACVKTETMEISADEITLSGDNFRFIEAVGNVRGKNYESKMDFTCGTMKYDRTTKVANLEDSVHLIDIKNKVTADAQMIEYDQETDIAIMQMNVNLKQKNNLCTCSYAVYKKKAQRLEMSGNPKIVQDDDTFRAQEITLNLETQEITLDGRVQGAVTDTKSEGKGASDSSKEKTSKPAQNDGGKKEQTPNDGGIDGEKSSGEGAEKKS